MTEWVQDDKYQVYGGWSFQRAAEPTAYYVDTDAAALNLWPIPENASVDGLLVRAVLEPSDDATEVPDWIFKRFKQAIAFGAAAGLMEMTNKPWANVELAAVFSKKYLDRRLDAHMRKQSGLDKREQSPNYPFFTGSRGRSGGSWF